MRQYGFYYDQSRCIGCNTCRVACKDWNGLNPGDTPWRVVNAIEIDTVTGEAADLSTTLENFERYFISYSCNHCETPACAAACGSGAIIKRKEDGAVLIDQDRCAGLLQCISACPYAAPHKYMTADGLTKAHKCTMCFDRLEQGKKPICADACIQRAIDFGPLDELKERHTTGRTTVVGFPADDKDQNGNTLSKPTNPSILFKAK